MRIALVTCRDRSTVDVDVDHERLLEAVARIAGVEASWQAWDDPWVDWSTFDRAILRSTWNYHLHRDAFLRWIDDVGRVCEVRNPPSVIRWNTDKRYLGELAEAGFGVVPTAYVDRGQRGTLAEWMDQRGFEEVVVKPTVSCGSFETHRFRRDAVDGTDLATLARDREMMVQPYIAEVEGSGERAIVTLGGEPSHAMRKTPRFDGGDERTERAPLAVDEAAFARRLVAWTEARFGTKLLYGRVDVVRRRSGELVVMELELTEPSLFLGQQNGAADHFARLITA